MTKQKLSLEDALVFSLKAYYHNFLKLLAASLIFSLSSFLLIIWPSLLLYSLMPRIWGTLSCLLLLGLFGGPIAFAWTNAFLRFHERRTFFLFDLYHFNFSFKLSLQLIVGYILYYLIAVALGFAFLIPGPFLMPTYLLFNYALVEQRIGLQKAFKSSALLTKGSRLDILSLTFVLFTLFFPIYFPQKVVAWGFSKVGILIVLTLVIAILLLVYLPLSTIVNVYLYKKLKEQTDLSSLETPSLEVEK